MSTGNVGLDILLGGLKENINDGHVNEAAVSLIQGRYPDLSKNQAAEISQLIASASSESSKTHADLIVTAPPSFSIRAKSTFNTVQRILTLAQKSITITGYSLSEYFNDLVDDIIRKSQAGILVRFFLNDLENQVNIDKLLRYKGHFLQIYNYKNKNDAMSALHAKVICIDGTQTLITSANLSYHGQEANIEMGSLIESDAFARQVEDLFTRLIFLHVFERLN